jgi:formylglycine-generating enzyme required for sulfatase activity
MQQPHFDFFLSHNSLDKPAVAALASKLQELGLNPWFDVWHLVPGEAWLPAIQKALASSKACVIAVGSNGFGKVHEEEMWVALQHAMEQKRSDHNYRVIPVLLPHGTRGDRVKLPAFLAARTWVEFRRSINEEAALARLANAIRGESAIPAVQVPIGESPYRGMKHFDIQHAPLFFGREVLTDWILSRLRGTASTEGATRFLAIVGASGSGKSSLARAGVLAQLKAGEIPGSQVWAQIICRPESDPLLSLATAIASLDENVVGLAAKVKLIRECREGLERHEDHLHLCAQALAPPNDPDWRLVVFVDQFEELFTNPTGNTEKGDSADRSIALKPDRVAFARNLLRAATISNGKTVVILTMRSDFYGNCVALEELRAAVSQHHELVGPMSVDELHRAIELPASLAQCPIEPGLVELLVREVAHQPGALPLLQDALAELWNKTRETDGTRLTTETYRALGGWEGTLSRRADAMLERLKAKGQESLCRQLFLDLINLGEGTAETKRLVRWSELKPNGAADAENLRSLIETLAREDVRLVTTNGDRNADDWTVEIVHEALIRAWGTLRGWLDEGRKELRLKRQLTDVAQRWYSSGDRAENRSPHRLYVGTDLEEARQWATDSRGQLPNGVRECLEASERAEQLREHDALHAQAVHLVEALRTAATTAVPELLPKLEAVRSWAEPLLKQQFEASVEHSDGKLHAALGLLPDFLAIDYLQQQLLLTSAPQFAVIRDQLQPHADAMSQSLWTAVGSPPANGRAAFQAACALATYATEDDRWSKLAPAVAQELVRQNPMVVNHWVEALRPVRHRLLAPLAALYEDITQRESARNLAVSVLSDYGAEDGPLLVRLLLCADPAGFEQLLEPVRRHQLVVQGLLKRELEAAPPEVGARLDEYEPACEAHARRQSRAVLALARLGEPEQIWPRLAFHPQPGQPRTQDPSLRTELIHDLAAFGVDLKLIVQRLEQEIDPSIFRSLILVLGEFADDQCPSDTRDQIVEQLELRKQELFVFDAGIFGATEWLLRRWHKLPESGLLQRPRELPPPQIISEEIKHPRMWYTNSINHRMIILPGGEMLMGTAQNDQSATRIKREEQQHWRRIERPFAIASTMVTRDQFIKFLMSKNEEPLVDEVYVKTSDSPITQVDWYSATEFCNWLSAEEGIPSNQWCYLPNKYGDYRSGMGVPADFLDRCGYRLPTEAEWELACRAGSGMSRYFGVSIQRLTHYAWYQENSEDRTWPVGLKKPNDAGLFDMLGNAYEWCHDGYYSYPSGGGVYSTTIQTQTAVQTAVGAFLFLQDGDGIHGIMRGGGFSSAAQVVRSGYRCVSPLAQPRGLLGFRIARTYR